MKLPKSLPKPSSRASSLLGRLNKPKFHSPVIVRRVMGFSMAPALLPGKLVVAHRLFWRLKRGHIVIVLHDGHEKIKRVAEVDKDHIYVLGDNPERSTDSRQFGWLSKRHVIGKVLLKH